MDMFIEAPRKHNKESLETDGARIEEDIWEIGVPWENCIEWCILLSFFQSSELFSTLIKRTTHTNTNFSRVLSEFNPFENRFSFFKTAKAKSLVKKIAAQFRISAISFNKLRLIRRLFQRSVLIYKDKVPSFKTYRGNDTPGIILFVYTANDDIINVSCGVKRCVCTPLREKALNCILKEAVQNGTLKDEAVADIWTIAKFDEHFLIAVLKSDFKKSVIEIYNSSHIVYRLLDAGYEAYPTTKNLEGLSSFYYAIESEDPELYLNLYFFVIQHSKERNSYRYPNEEVLNNLRHLKEVLQNDLSKFSLESRDRIEATFNCLLRVTDFLIEIDEKIVEILDSGNEGNTEDRENAQSRKRVIESILEVYRKHLDSLQSLEDNKSYLENFVIYKCYFDLIDMLASLLFFDNIHLLQEKLCLKNKNEYEQIETAFFITALSVVIFNKKIKTCENFARFCTQSKNVPYKIIQKIREDVKERINWFSDLLKDITIDEQNLRKRVPINETISVLESCPEIKDYLLAKRLMHYLEYATNMEFNKKSAFVIERVLQVLGEFMKLKPDDKSIKWFISLYMPENIRTVLHHLRNKLTHLDSKSTTVKFHYEEKFHQFHSIQKEIALIYKYLQPLLYVFNSRMENYVEEKLKESVRQHKMPEECQSTLECYLPHMVRNILDVQDENSNENASSLLDNYVIVFEIILKHSDELILEENKIRNPEDQKLTSIRSMIHPLMCVIKWTQDFKESELLNIFRKFEICFNLNNLKDFIETFKNLKIEWDNFMTEWRRKNRRNDSLQKISDIKNIETFLKSLKSGRPILSDKDIKTMKSYRSPTSSEDLERKEKLETSITDHFSLSREALEEYKLSYLSEAEWDRFVRDYLKKKKKHAHNLINRIKTPAERLDNIILLSDKISKEDYDWVKTNISDNSEVLGILQKLLDGTKRNKLIVLLNRVNRLQEILILEDKDIHRLWNSLSSQFQNPQIQSLEQIDEYLSFKNIIISRYKANLNVQFSVEILLMDCMDLFPRNADYLWKKPLQLYSGINIHNVLAHGHIILEKLCELLDPKDLRSDIIEDALRLLRDRSCILAINVLYEEEAGRNFQNFKNLLEAKKADEHGEKRNKIFLCQKHKEYIDLLPKTPTSTRRVKCRIISE